MKISNTRKVLLLKMYEAIVRRMNIAMKQTELELEKENFDIVLCLYHFASACDAISTAVQFGLVASEEEIGKTVEIVEKLIVKEQKILDEYKNIEVVNLSENKTGK